MALVVTFFLTLFIQACSGAPDVTEALLLLIPEAQQLGLTDLARLARMVLTVGMLPVMTTFLKYAEWRIDRARRRASRGSGDHHHHHHDHHQEHHHQYRRPYMDMCTLTG